MNDENPLEQYVSLHFQEALRLHDSAKTEYQAIRQRLDSRPLTTPPLLSEIDHALLCSHIRTLLGVSISQGAREQFNSATLYEDLLAIKSQHLAFEIMIYLAQFSNTGVEILLTPDLPETNSYLLN